MSNRERTIESKGRIEFIDLAKGICILLVVMIHVGVPEYIPGLYAAKVPIFFLLSGLFFLKKVNFFFEGGYWNKLCTTIVIPFLAYYLISYAMFYVIDRVIPNVLGGKQDFSIIDVFRQRNLFNGPLWFLICLAEVEALLYVVWKCIRTNMMKCAFISSLAILGFLLASYKIFIPMWLDTAMVASLFFYFGILISETNFLIKGTKSLYLVLGAVICYLIYIFFPVKISMSVNYYSNTYLTVVSGMAIVVFILLVCKLVNQILVINWIGRNSLVLLCTHHLVYRPIKYFLIHFGYDYPLLLFVLTIIVEIPIIFIINRYFPVLAGKGKLVVRS